MGIGSFFRRVLRAVFNLAFGKVVRRVRAHVLRSLRRLGQVLYDRVFTWAFRKVF